MSKERIKRLKTVLKQNNLDAILVTNGINVRYLSGYTGTEGTLLVTARAAYFFSDSRYTEQAKKQVTDAKNIIFTDKIGAIGKQVARLSIDRMGIEGNQVTVNTRKQLAKACKGVRLVALGGQVDALRLCKDTDEISALKEVTAVSETAFKKVIGKLVPGVVEADFGRMLDIAQLRLGAEGNSFETIIASGYRGALPHGVASDKVVVDGDLVVIDFGAIMNGYNSDQTVTVAVGKCSALAKKVYQIVYDAQRYAIEAARPGLTGAQLDFVARAVIEKAGYGKYFGHGLGHGLGLEIHEDPRASRLYARRLAPGMVVTIEPGIYLPGKFGVRHEDVVLITDGGCELLTSLDKKWKGR